MGEIYRQCAEAKLKRLELSREERELVWSLGGRLGYLDREMQLRQLELCEEETRRRLEDLRKEMPDKRKYIRVWEYWEEFFWQCFCGSPGTERRREWKSPLYLK